MKNFKDAISACGRSLALLAALLLAGCTVLNSRTEGVNSPRVGGARSLRAEVQVLPAPETVRMAIDPDSLEAWAEVLQWTHESAICILSGSIDGFNWVRYRSDFFSPDGNQGSVISRAAWSPSGPYLAYQIYSSGGHQPYWSPIVLVDVENWEELSIQEKLDEFKGEDSWFISGDEGDFSWSADGRLHFSAGNAGTSGKFAYDPKTRQIMEVRESSKT